jgi:glyceraldehyde-3-phosphate dehydrogenase (NADP+)
MYIARQLQVGTVQINGRPTRGPDHFPSHGVKESGMGSLGANHSILAMTRARTIVLNLRDQHP